MLISHNWLQKYFDKELPEPNKLAGVLNTHSFEVEGIDEVTLKDGSKDTVIDIDILPNRSHDCLCHYGIAKEAEVLTGLKAKKIENKDLGPGDPSDLKVTIEDAKKCRRYIAVEMSGIKVGPSPQWLKNNLESIGQKSINNIVDATNYVMFNIGQPLHAFDKDKLEGNEINIRQARLGEKIITLDNKEVELNEEVLIIADGKSPLAIAGVKGGKKAEVGENTTNLVLESANFDSVTVRSSARGFSILTDSSKRFENEISTELAGVAMRELVELIKEIAGGEAVGKTDVYPRKPADYKVGFTTAEANKILGLNLSDKEVEDILNKFGFSFEKVNPLEKVLELASTFVGVPYESGASVIYDAPRKFDCSSFTAYLFTQAGIAIPRISVDQYVFGKEISESDLKAGDLVFVNSGLVVKTGIYTKTIEFLPGTEVPEGVDHVGLYLGDNKIIYTSSHSQAGKVVVHDLGEAEMFKNIVGYRRIIDAQINADGTRIDADKVDPKSSETNGQERYVVTIPYERMDLRIKEDIIEEIGRIYGLENIKSLTIEKIREPKVHKGFYYTNKVRQILTDLGFQEIYNYTFTDKGEVKVEKPLASDKGMLRTNLSDGVKDRLEFNLKNAPLLCLDEIKLFEIGKVFPSMDEEYNSLCIGTTAKKGGLNKGCSSGSEADRGGTLVKELSDLGINLLINEQILEVNLDELIEKLPQPETYDDILINTDDSQIKYKHISSYPFMLRDIAVFVPEGKDENDVLKVITENAGDLLVKTKLFDTYKPAGETKTSYAFNLVFQSREKTLTDDEINKIMEDITNQMIKNSWEVR